jgi:hypothetical protein
MDGTAMRQSDMFYKNPAFDMVLDMQQMGPWGNRCIKTKLGWCSANSIYEDFDLVLDYMNIVEGNNTSPVVRQGLGDAWQQSRSSNWRNWFDLHLEWANIDPTKVADSDKRPIYTLLPGEADLFKGLRARYSNLFVIQANSSSLSRTWYQAEKLPKMLLEAYENPAIVFWNSKQNVWIMQTREGATKLALPDHSPLRSSMALVNAADLFIGADTGFTHVAEGLGVKHIAIYSTVPWWTRAKHYKHQIPIDPGQNNKEFYTFNLGLGDPLRIQEGMASLSEREKFILELNEKGANVQQAAEALNTDEEGAKLELQSVIAKKASFERQQSKALSTVTPEMVMAEIKKAVTKGLK